MTGNLLTEAIISVFTTDGTSVRLTLPGVLAALQRDEVGSFAAVQPHQAHPWHAFLVQLGAMALEGEELPLATPGRADLPGPDTEAAWAARLRRLTPDHPDDAPWTLAVDDLAKPAFLQPPVPEDTWGKTTKIDYFPDDLDILISTKNHQIKSGKASKATLEHWMFALLSLQTMAGYSGPTWNGISKMFTGTGARPGVHILSRSTLGGQWARDVRIVLDNPDNFRKHGLPFDPVHGLKLLWVAPWDGKKSLELRELHPLFIEICRRIRLHHNAYGTLSSKSIGTEQVLRIQAKEQNGDMADPWTPVLKSNHSAFNRTPGYRAVQAVLFPADTNKEQYAPALLQMRHPPDEGHDLAVRFRILIRGQGKTEGFHERTIPIPKAAEVFAFGPRTPDAARLCQAMVELASTAQNKVLKPALLRFMQAARERIEFKQPETAAWAETWTRRLDQEVDLHFFPTLWECLPLLKEGEDAVVQAPWRERLRTLAMTVFTEATQALPVPLTMRPRAVALAEEQFQRAVREHLAPKRIKEDVRS
ncbi:hypothetical protein [Nitratidesulfovibrio termitidis]|uniref:hypothetical protein n=1 Tax=Nitratidesulfovibrio termitidis TaxID=42252 RepID=UPI00040341F8|nr:hypothetical protein [Nitratidesulfovibrio termitidis]